MDRNWRAIRLYAAGQTLSIQNKSPPATRVGYSSLLLTAGLVWFINSLHSRPDEGSSSNQLKAAIFPCTDNMDDPSIIVRISNRHRQDENMLLELPYCPGRVFFLRRIYWPPTISTPRLGIGREISRKSWQYFFKQDYATIKEKLYHVGFITPVPNPNRPPVRKGRTQLVTDPPPDRPIFPELEDLEIIEAVDIGDDIPPELQLDPDESTPAEIMMEMWLQSFSDFLQKVGNPRIPRDAPSWCRLDMKAREHAKPDHFKTYNLGTIFTSVMWRRADRDEWKKAFSIIWPDKQDIRPTGPWAQLRYMRQWKEFIAGLHPYTVTRIRKAIMKKFNELYWVPAATIDKIWHYKNDQRYSLLPPNAWLQRGPHILINYKMRHNPIFDPPFNREEEEEEEEDGDGDEDEDEDEER